MKKPGIYYWALEDVLYIVYSKYHVDYYGSENQWITTDSPTIWSSLNVSSDECVVLF